MSKPQLRYKVFGRQTGLRVSEMALGAGNFGTGWGHGAEPDKSRRMFDGFVASGGNFSAVAPDFPHQMMAGERSRGRVAGGRAELIDPPRLPVA